MSLRTKLFSFVMLLVFGFIFFANRSLFISSFDASYWVDKFEHSQWRLAASNRVLGDDGVYLVEGYKLVNGENPTLFNAEVPPLGKYLIGLSVKYLGNGYLYGFITTTLAVLAVGFVAWILTRNPLVVFATCLVVSLDPLIADQFPRTMLDSLQLLFLALSTSALLLENAPVSGLLFGLFSASKFPVLSPFIAIIFVYVLWKRTKKVSDLLMFLGMSLFGYLLPYVPYFLQGHTIVEWLSVQKYVISFYLNGFKPSQGATELSSILFGWSWTWPLITVGTVLAFVSKKQKQLLPVFATLLLFFLFYLTVPFWTRYLVVMLPFMYLATLLWVQSVRPTWFIPAVALLFLLNIVPTIHVLFPTPETTVKQFAYDWSHGYFQDMYERMSDSSKTVSRNAFFRFGQKTLYDGHIESASILLPTKWNEWTSPQQIPVTVTYYTRELGSFSEKTTLLVKKEGSQWKIAWQWNNLLSGLTETSHLVTTVDPATRGSITSGSTVLAKDEESIMVWITPENIDPKQETAMLAYLQSLFGNKIPGFRIHNRYAENNALSLPIPIGVVMQPKKFTPFPGINLTLALGRTENSSIAGTVANTMYDECCSLLYNTTSYDGVSGLEKKYNTTLKGQNGGTLRLEQEDGSVIKTLLDVPKKDGESVRF